MDEKQLGNLRLLLESIIIDLYYVGNGEARTKQLLGLLENIVKEAPNDA